MKYKIVSKAKESQVNDTAFKFFRIFSLHFMISKIIHGNGTIWSQKEFSIFSRDNRDDYDS